MTQAGGPSATMGSDETGHQPAALAGGWREGVLVLLMVLAPGALTIVLITGGIFAIVGWQLAHGLSVVIPARASLQDFGLLSYSVVSWIAVAVVWSWSSRRGLTRDVFIFRRLTWPALATSIVSFIVAMYGVPVMTHWLVNLTGGHGPDVRLNLHDTQSVAAFVLLFAVTAPLCEEILYRGLLVAWLRHVRWRDPAILLAGSLIFGANHVLFLGFVWSLVIVVFGAMLFALRLRCDSLTPGWLVHFLFNAQPVLTTPLIAWLAPALFPGRLS